MEATLGNHFLQSYDGGIHNRRYHGHGVVKFHNGNSYEGELEEGRMNGDGILKWMDGIVYQGQFSHNMVDGHGTYHWPDGSSYTGDIVHGKREGYGVWSRREITYEGEWKAGQKHGKGKCYFNEEQTSYYDGDWLNGKKHGWGVMVYASGNRYEGEWQENVKCGEGQMVWLVEPPSQAELEFNSTIRTVVLNGTVRSASQPPTEDDLGAIAQELGPKRRFERYTGTWKDGKPDGYGVYEWFSIPKEGPIGRHGTAGRIRRRMSSKACSRPARSVGRACASTPMALCWKANGSTTKSTGRGCGDASKAQWKACCLTWTCCSP